MEEDIGKVIRVFGESNASISLSLTLVIGLAFALIS
jgi:hypothetical protein